MKNTTAFLLLLISISQNLIAQAKHDNVWTIGYGQIYHEFGLEFGGVIMDFKTYPPSFEVVNYPLNIPFASISNTTGNLVAYTDGCRVANLKHEIMFNGIPLSPGETYNQFCAIGGNYPQWQPNLFLPKPGSDSLYYLFHIRGDDAWNSPINLLYSIVDASKNNGDGAVISRNHIVMSDSLYLGDYVAAARHANGRDWWVLEPRRFNNNIHVTLFTSDTVMYMGMQDLGVQEIDSAECCSQAIFSPDGSKYFRNSPESLLIMDFDRCTGTLSNPVRLDWDSLPYGGSGVAISPNNRYMYLTSSIYVVQYDLWATDLSGSRKQVALFDGYQSPYNTTFFETRLAPDGRVYINTTNANNVLHVIQYPDKAGEGCKVIQHGIALPALSAYILPNFANYRLGPIDGSSCDTLGIDNLPVAHFRWDVNDTLSPLNIEFTDLSYFEPATWLWDFGDGVISQDTSPVHAYATPGTYQVCLTVCNANACNTECQEVTVETVGTTTLSEQNSSVKISPNPAGETLRINSEDVIGHVRVFDTWGREAMSLVGAGQEQMTLDISRLPTGLYYMLVKTSAGVWSGKFERMAR